MLANRLQLAVAAGASAENKDRLRILLVTDFVAEERWFLLNYLRSVGYPAETLGTEYKLAYASRGYLKLIRWARWVALAYQSFERRREFDVIVFWNAIVGLFSACLFRVAGSTREKIILLNLIYHKKNWFQDALRTWIYRFAFQRVDFLAVGSEAIGQYYERLFGFPESKTTWFPERIEEHEFENVRADVVEDYVFAGGAANRDWETFFQAMRIAETPAVAVSWKHSFDGLAVPPNVSIRYDLPLETFHAVQWKSRLVVIPLRDPLMTSGMEVLLKSMALGKAIIATKTSVTEKYLEDGVSGLLVAPGDAAGLAARVKYLLENPETASRLGQQAQQRAREVFTPEHAAERIKSMIDSVCNKPPVRFSEAI